MGNHPGPPGRYFSHGVATAYSLGRQPQEFGTICVLAPEGRQHFCHARLAVAPPGLRFVLPLFPFVPSGLPNCTTSKSVSEGEAAIHYIPRLRFGLREVCPGGPGWLPTQVSHRSGRVELPHPVPPVMVSLRDVGHAPDGGQTLRRHCRYPLVLRVRIIRIPKHSRRVLPTSP